MEMERRQRGKSRLPPAPCPCANAHDANANAAAQRSMPQKRPKLECTIKGTQASCFSTKRLSPYSVP